MNFLTIFSKTVIAGALSVAAMLGVHQNVQQNAQVNATPPPVLGAYNTAAGGTYRLQVSLGSTDTTIRLSSFKDPRNDVPLTMSYLSTSVAYGTLDPQQPSRSELISFTGITQNSDGTAALTGVTRGLLGVYPYTASTTLRKTHAGQSIFILSDAPQVFNEYAAKQNNETVTGSWTFATTTFNGSSTFVGLTRIENGATSTFSGPVTFSASTTFNSTTSLNGATFVNTPTASTSIANKGYVDGVAAAGCANADTTTKGCSEEATAAEVNSGVSVGGSGARLFISPMALASSTVISSAVNGAISSSSVVYSHFDGFATGVSVFTIASTTNGIVGRIFTPSDILASSISVAGLDPTKPGNLVIAIFSHDGQRKIAQATTTLATPGAPFSQKITFSTPVSIPAGVYYVAVVADAVVSTPIAIFTPTANNIEIAGEPIVSGMFSSLTVGQMPASFNPVTGISTSTVNTTLRFRLDN